MATLKWGSLELEYITDERVQAKLFNEPIILYDGTVVSFRPDKKYYDITVEGVCEDIDAITAILSNITQEDTLTIAGVSYSHAFLVDFSYEYWKTDCYGHIWYKYTMRFIAR